MRGSRPLGKGQATSVMGNSRGVDTVTASVGQPANAGGSVGRKEDQTLLPAPIFCRAGFDQGLAVNSENEYSDR